MNAKNNLLLILVIVVLVAAVSFSERLFRINYAAVTFVAAGLACGLLYMTKRKLWSLFCGISLLCLGAMLFMSDLMPQAALSRLANALFFLIPALILLVLFLQSGRRKYYSSACYLLMFGIFFMLMGLSPMRRINAPLFVCAMGLVHFSSRRLKRLSQIGGGVSMGGEYGQVTERLDESHILVKIKRTEACAKCGMCHPGAATEDMVLRAKNTGANPSDLVKVELDSGNFLSAAVLMYFVPFLFLLAGYAGGYYLAEALGFHGSSPFIGFALGIALTAVVYRFLHSKEKLNAFEGYTPTASRIADYDGREI
jgi:sigma-E factor negative regulatory protein RseC